MTNTDGSESIGPMDCNELVELVTDYLDGAMDLETRARFDMHLLECDGCKNYLQQLRVTIDVVSRIDAEQLDPNLCGRLLVAFRDWR